MTTSSTPAVRYDRDVGIVTLTLDDPQAPVTTMTPGFVGPARGRRQAGSRAIRARR